MTRWIHNIGLQRNQALARNCESPLEFKPDRLERSVQQVRIFYNRLVEVRRCLTEDWWEWLAWTAASGTGYTPREFVTIDVLKGGMIYGAR